VRLQRTPIASMPEPRKGIEEWLDRYGWLMER
jgi:hypothetical protein